MATGGWFSFFFGVSRHWRTRSDLRTLAYYGFGALALAAGLLILSVSV
jgi:hypothetical protein